MPAVEITNLSVAYDGQLALSGVDLEIRRPSTLAVIGPNGSGKSTLLRAIAGLITPNSGQIKLHNSRLALVLQSTDVDRSVPITVRDTVAMARYPRRGYLGRFGADDREAIEDAMARMDVADLARRQLHDLSGGQRQRVLVAQGLAQDADVLMLDEPVTGLDIVSRERILDVVDAERERGRLVLMTTHNLEDARRCDQVLLLATRPVAVGTPDSVLQEEYLREAFGGRVIRSGEGFVLDDPHHSH